MTVGLFSMMRNENRYVEEFINHYRALGVDHIWIGDNNTIGDNSLTDLITSLNLNDFVTILDMRGWNVADHGAIIANFMNEHCTEYDWLCVVDADEFLYISNSFCEQNIKKYIEKCCNNYETNFNIQPNVIQIGWLIYGDSGNVLYENKPVTERFTQLSDKIYLGNFFTNELAYTGKSIFNSHVAGRVKNPHMIYPNDNYGIDIHVCINGGENVGECSHGNGFKRNDAHIKHYYTKSLQEYIERRTKYLRHYAYIWKTFDDFINTYKEVNEWNEEKQKYVDEYKKRHGIE